MSDLKDAHIHLYGAYLELFRRKFGTWALMSGKWGTEISEPELREAIDAICEELRKICRLSDEMHIHFKAEVQKTVFAARKDYWVKR